jgi:hypothetical protein
LFRCTFVWCPFESCRKFVPVRECLPQPHPELMSCSAAADKNVFYHTLISCKSCPTVIVKSFRKNSRKIHFFAKTFRKNWGKIHVPQHFPPQFFSHEKVFYNAVLHGSTVFKNKAMPLLWKMSFIILQCFRNNKNYNHDSKMLS